MSVRRASFECPSSVLQASVGRPSNVLQMSVELPSSIRRTSFECPLNFLRGSVECPSCRSPHPSSICRHIHRALVIMSVMHISSQPLSVRRRVGCVPMPAIASVLVSVMVRRHFHHGSVVTTMMKPLSHPSASSVSCSDQHRDMSR